MNNMSTAVQVKRIIDYQYKGYELYLKVQLDDGSKKTMKYTILKDIDPVRTHLYMDRHKIKP
ncbi:hypothetical protein G210_1219 [Candida maltosa Xu316]|uniref:Uncharacterized protein n=1 Tax=Candida maltosa (strain Xu316) TaxID=1245528 RepID=M3IP84_CANMX|nr:hypothetical protein G210_1219 [Candida maltosa Xu316]